MEVEGEETELKKKMISYTQKSAFRKSLQYARGAITLDVSMLKMLTRLALAY